MDQIELRNGALINQARANVQQSRNNMKTQVGRQIPPSLMGAKNFE